MKKRSKRLTKAEKITKRIADYIQENFSYEIVEGDIGDTVISLLERVKKQNNVWKDKHGTKWNFNEIEDRHLTNILKYLEERAKIQAVRESVREEKEELMTDWKKNLPIIYTLLREERDRREQEEVMEAVRQHALNCRCTVDEALDDILDETSSLF